MGIMVYSLTWVMQDLYHQPYPPRQTSYRSCQNQASLGRPQAPRTTSTKPRGAPGFSAHEWQVDAAVQRIALLLSTGGL